MSIILSKREQQAKFEIASSGNRYPGSGGGSGLFLPTLGFAAAGNQGNYSTANNSTWTDITNTSFTITVGRATDIEYRVTVATHLSAAGALGYIRGNIVSYDVTASLPFGATVTTNGFMWYMALQTGKSPLPPGQYTVKLQAATDNNTFNITVDQFFHQVLARS